MDIRALLLKAPLFDLGKSGQLVIEPEGIVRACESRRRQVKEIVSRILDPLAVPETEEAAAFWLTDSFDQRKMFVHRREHSLLEVHRNSQVTDGSKNAKRSTHGTTSKPPLEQSSSCQLPTKERTTKLFESIWDLDRIYGYLATEYLFPKGEDVVDILHHAAVSWNSNVSAPRPKEKALCLCTML